MSKPIVSHVEEDLIFDMASLASTSTTSGGSALIASGSSSLTTSWALDSIDGTRDLHYHRPSCNLTGEGVDVYIIDTGIDYDNKVEFGERAEFSGCDLVDRLTARYDANAALLGGQDCAGHGTGVAGLVGGASTGVAPGVRLLSVRSIYCNFTTTTSLLVSALECIREQVENRSRPSIVQTSVFGESSRSVKQSIDVLINHGITMVTLSGNVPRGRKPRDSCKVAPGSYRGVVTVAGVRRDNRVYELTNMGICVDILAPGEYVQFPVLSRDCPGSSTNTSCYTVGRGGSYAAPLVSGALALLLQKCPKLPQWKIRYHLTTNMAIFDAVLMDTIPRRYRRLTPNLYLHVGDNMCAITC